MGTAHGEYEDFHAANRRAKVIDWLNGLLPVFDLPLDSSDEELREYLIDGMKKTRISSQSIKQEMYALQMKWRDEISNIGLDLKGLVDAAENYHRVLAKNQKLFNEVQELKGNIRVYCRVRPYLPGQDVKSTTIDYIGENGDILIVI